MEYIHSCFICKVKKKWFGGERKVEQWLLLVREFWRLVLFLLTLVPSVLMPGWKGLFCTGMWSWFGWAERAFQLRWSWEFGVSCCVSALLSFPSLFFPLTVLLSCGSELQLISLRGAGCFGLLLLSASPLVLWAPCAFPGEQPGSACARIFGRKAGMGAGGGTEPKGRARRASRWKCLP